MLDHLTHLQRRTTLNRTHPFIPTLLNLNPILHFHNNLILPFHNIPTPKKPISRIFQLFDQHPSPPV
ncbi:DegV family protein, partial [Bacillus pumilus]|uniref:DegV family protein n=1 Tax=Bacillus pumilus TaxID=1408 RepID=UPI0034D96E10